MTVMDGSLREKVLLRQVILLDAGQPGTVLIEVQGEASQEAEGGLGRSATLNLPSRLRPRSPRTIRKLCLTLEA
jgi:hypothetical protein